MVDRKCRRLFPAVLALLAAVVFSSLPAGAGTEIETAILSQFDVFEADLRDVFRSLAELGELNVLLDKDVAGIVTVNLKHGLTISEAIELLARTYGYSYRWIIPRRTIIIGREQTFAGWEERETRVYRLHYADPEEIVKALEVMIPSGQIGVDERTNQLTINANLLEHQNIEEIIARLDRRMPQINIEARVEEINLTAAEELGITWSFPEFGLDSDLRFHLITRQTLRAMEEKGAARLLANPNISTTDGQEGRIFIGDRLPVITTRVTEGRIEDVITYVEAGTILTVIPKINDERTVTVTVKAEVSNIVSWRTGGTGAEVPVVRTREASSVVRLREGETFVLSGLNMQQDVEHTTAVPFFSRIPLLGLLFQSKSVEREETEICIFLTPYIVHPSEEKETPTPLATTGETEPEIPVVTGTAGVSPEIFQEPGVDWLLSETTLTVEVPAGQKELEIEVVWPADDPVLFLEIGEPSAGEREVEQEDEREDEGEREREERIRTQPGGKYYEEYLARMEERRRRTEPPEKEKPAARPPGEDGGGPEREEERNERRGRPEPGIKLTYRVKEGETLFTIAQKYGLPPEWIKEENDLDDTGLLTPGSPIVLSIPEAHLYRLGPGETLWRLARRYNVTVENLMEINNITDVTTLETGRLLILPVPVDRVADENY